jgi:hypothetical protein
MRRAPGSHRPPREQQEQDDAQEKLLLLGQLEHRAICSRFDSEILPLIRPAGQS